MVLNTINNKTSTACQHCQIFLTLYLLSLPCLSGLLSFTVKVWKTLIIFFKNSVVDMGFGDIIEGESGCLRQMVESLKYHCCFVSVISKGNINPI